MGLRSRPTSAKLVIYDVSSVIYAGNSSKYSTDYLGYNNEERVKGVAVGGVRRILQQALYELTGVVTVLFVFDSKTNRKEIFPKYKAYRKYNPDIAVQKEMLFEIANRIGIPCIKIDGYEADDLIAKVVRQELNNFSAIEIVTGDTDIASNLISKKVRIIGSAGIYPSIDVDTYESLIKQGELIAYNSVLPYYFFMGKAANTVPAIKSTSESIEMYKDFMSWVKTTSFTSNQYSESVVMYNYLAHLAESGMDEDTILRYIERMEYIYPNMPEEDLDFELISQADLFKAELLFFLKLFNMQRIAELYGLEEYHGTNFSREMNTFILNYKTMADSGSFTDITTTPDISFFVNRSSHFSGDLEV